MAANVELEKLGIPSTILVTEPFSDACKGMAKMGGMPDLKYPILRHPIGSLPHDELMERARSAVEQYIPIVTGNPHT